MNKIIKFTTLFAIGFFGLLCSCEEESGSLEGPAMSMEVVFIDSSTGKALGNVNFHVDRVKYSGGDIVNSKSFDVRIGEFEDYWKQEFVAYSIKEEGEIQYRYGFSHFEKSGYYASYEFIQQDLTIRSPRLRVKIYLAPSN